MRLHADHVVAWSRGEETSLEDLRTACSDCNLRRGAGIRGGAAAPPTTPSQLRGAEGLEPPRKVITAPYIGMLIILIMLKGRALPTAT